MRKALLVIAVLSLAQLALSAAMAAGDVAQREYAAYFGKGAAKVGSGEGAFATSGRLGNYSVEAKGAPGGAYSYVKVSGSGASGEALAAEIALLQYYGILNTTCKISGANEILSYGAAAFCAGENFWEACATPEECMKLAKTNSRVAASAKEESLMDAAIPAQSPLALPKKQPEPVMEGGTGVPPLEKIAALPIEERDYGTGVAEAGGLPLETAKIYVQETSDGGFGAAAGDEGANRGAEIGALAGGEPTEGGRNAGTDAGLFGWKAGIDIGAEQVLQLVAAFLAVIIASYLILQQRNEPEITHEVERLLSNETRAGILEELSVADKIPTDLSNRLGKSKATIVEHLDTLVCAGIVERIETEGRKFVYYRLTQRGKQIRLKRAG